MTTSAEKVKKRPPVTLICAVCGKETKGRQWHNRDQGYGLCAGCLPWLEERETACEIQRSYGVKGIHFAVDIGQNRNG